MKILMINSVCGVGSTGRICTDLAQILETQGHTVKIAYGRQAAPEQFAKYGIRIGSDIEVRVNGVLTRLFDNEGFNAYFATKKFLRWVEEFDPDIVHLHNLHGYYLHIGLLFEYLKRANKKVIWTLHDCWTFTGHCAHFTAVDCDKWQSQCHGCPQKHVYPKAMLLSGAKQNFRKKRKVLTGVKDLTLVTPSQWLADLTRLSFLGEYPVKVVPNGINLDVFQPAEGNLRQQYALEQKKIILGVANVWNASKGLDDFVKLAEMLDDEYKIVLIGLEEEQVKKLPKNIIGITRTNNIQELVQWYSCADVFFNPTYEDTYPTVNLEAIACGTPVVTYRTGGSPESITPESGRVVPCGDLQQACEAIADCIENIKTAKNEQNFDARHRLGAYIDLYSEDFGL